MVGFRHGINAVEIPDGYLYAIAIYGILSGYVHVLRWEISYKIESSGLAYLRIADI